LHPNIFPKKNCVELFWLAFLDFWLVGVLRRSPRQKSVLKKLAGKCERFFLFSRNFQKIAFGKSKICCIFLKLLKCKGAFFLNSSNRLLSSKSKDVFTDSLPAIRSRVMADINLKSHVRGLCELPLRDEKQ